MELITGRRTVRHFQERPVEREKLRRLLRAGAHAPSAHDLQAWRAVVLDDRALIGRFAAEAAKSYRRSLLARKVDGASAKSEAARRRMEAVPAMILLCLATGELRRERSSRRAANERLMGAQSVAAMAENVLLAAPSLGLGACWRGVALFLGPRVGRLLRLPTGVEPQVLIELGYPASAPRQRKLRSLEEIAHYNGW